MGSGMADPITERDLHDALTDLRADQGVVIARLHETMRREVQLELKSFKNEMRVLVVGAFVVLGFDVPQGITAAAIGAVTVKAVGSALLARFN